MNFLGYRRENGLIGIRNHVLVISSVSCANGVVEAIESTSDDWVAMGTQFHPENDSASALDLRIFEEFFAGITGEAVEMRLVA